MWSDKRVEARESGRRRSWSISFLAICPSFSSLVEPVAWKPARAEALYLAAEKEGIFWVNGVQAGAGEAR